MHFDGKGHKRTIALLKKLGRPIPKEPEFLKDPYDDLPTKVTQTVVGVTSAGFVSGGKLETLEEKEREKERMKEEKSRPTEANGEKPDLVETKLKKEKVKVKLKIVGEEFLETESDKTGKFIRYKCILCDCDFTDVNAKDFHLSGRRHRQNYQTKFQPPPKIEKPKKGKKMVFMQMPPRHAIPPRVPYPYPGRPWFGHGPGWDPRFHMPTRMPNWEMVPRMPIRMPFPRMPGEATTRLPAEPMGKIWTNFDE